MKETLFGIVLCCIAGVWSFPSFYSGFMFGIAFMGGFAVFAINTAFKKGRIIKCKSSKN